MKKNSSKKTFKNFFEAVDFNCLKSYKSNHHYSL